LPILPVLASNSMTGAPLILVCHILGRMVSWIWSSIGGTQSDSVLVSYRSDVNHVGVTCLVLTSTGRGADIMVPMAIPAFGGMNIEVMTMFVIPTLYCAIRESKLKAGTKDARLERENLGTE